MSVFDDDMIEAARKTFAGPITFLKSAPKLEHLPNPVVPEVAFAGRSNVGKSSLINALTNRNSLARTSNTPGRTQELNFFDVGDPLKFRLVDMPGYGFAKAPKDMQRQWRYLVNDFLRGRDVLKRALVLIDSRHGIKKNDEEVLTLLDKAAVSYQVVLTKTDKIKDAGVPRLIEETRLKIIKRPAAYPEVLSTSSEKGRGLDELRNAILTAIER